MFPVLKHVNDCIADRAGRRERARVVPLGKHGAPAAEDAIDGAREPDRKSLDAAREHVGVVGFDEQVNVIGLHGEMHDPKPFARGPRETPPKQGKSRLSERRQLGSDAQRHMRGMRLSVHRTPAMGNRGAVPRRTSRAGTPATAASAFKKVQLLIAVTAGFLRLFPHIE